MSSTLVATKKKRKKKIVIRPYEKPPQVPPDFYETQSRVVLDSTRSILSSSSKNASLQEAHQSVHDLVQHKYGARLYGDLVQSLREAAASVVTTTSSVNLLEYVPRQFAVYTDYLEVVRHVCLPLDRQYVWNGTQGVTRKNGSSDAAGSLWQVGLQIFLERLQTLSLDVELYQAWWKELWQDWKETSGNKQLMDTMVVWHELGCKSKILRQQLQPQLISHLQQESKLEMDSEKFVSYVYNKWNHISQHWTFLPRLWVRTLVEVQLLQPHLPKLLHDLDIENLEHVSKLWMLTSRLVQGSIQMAQAIAEKAKSRGMLIMNMPTFNSAAAVKSIQGLLDLQHLLQVLEKRLHTTLPLKSVWTMLMGESQAAEALAKYMDVSMKSTKTTVELESVLQLFCHVQAKDVFEAFYKKDLAKRLLGGRVQNMDLERQFVSLLKSECGAGYTSKMEGMFQDVEWSRETMARYTPSASTQVDMDVQVLTTGYWPVYPNYKLHLPSSLIAPQEHFCEYYKKTYQGRRIAWQYSLGHATVKAKFAKTYDLVMSLPLALVVLCFNDAEKKWTLPQLMKQVGLDDRSEMERILKTLSLGKVKLLQKWDYDAQQDGSPQKPRPNILDQDWFTVNQDFSSPLKKIKISLIAKTDAATQERQKTMEAISRDRLYLLDAVLVRILKARKTMMHSDLIPLVLEHAKVPATPTDVKHRIESLIEREYLERDAQDRNRYNYLA